MSSVERDYRLTRLGCDHVENKRQRDQKEMQAPRTGLHSLREAANPLELSNQPTKLDPTQRSTGVYRLPHTVTEAK